MSKTQKVLTAAKLCTKLYKHDAHTSLEHQLNTEGERKRQRQHITAKLCLNSNLWMQTLHRKVACLPESFCLETLKVYTITQMSQRWQYWWEYKGSNPEKISVTVFTCLYITSNCILLQLFFCFFLFLWYCWIADWKLEHIFLALTNTGKKGFVHYLLTNSSRIEICCPLAHRVPAFLKENNCRKENRKKTDEAQVATHMNYTYTHTHGY